MSFKIRSYFYDSSLGLFGYTFADQSVSVLYATHELAPPAVFEFLSPFAFLGFLSWWLMEDSRRNAIRWPMDMGMFLQAAWLLIVPYHLFKTRGIRAIVYALLLLLALWVAALLAGFFVAVISIVLSS